MKLLTGINLKIVVLLLLSVLFYFLLNFPLSMESIWTKVVVVIVILIPILVWGAIFRKLDVEKPEPIQMVFLSFALGVLISKYIMMPIKDVSIEYIWGNNLFSIWSIITFALFYGFIAIFLLLGTMRLMITTSEFFDEPIDAIIYSSTIGLGFAFALNLDFAFSLEKVNLGVVTAKVMVNTLAYSAASSVLGIAVAKAKFRGISDWSFALNTVGASLLFGVIYALDNFLRFLSPFGVQYQKIGNLIIIGLISFLAMMYVGFEERKIKKLSLESKRKTISSKPSLFVTLIAAVVMMIIGSQVRTPAYFEVKLGDNLSIKCPINSSIVKSEKNYKVVQVPFEGEVYKVYAVRLKGKSLNDLIVKYKLGLLPLTPANEPRRLVIEDKPDSSMAMFSYYKVLVSPDTYEPALIVGIDHFIKAGNEFWLLRVEGKNISGCLNLIKRLLEER